jgi:hypothetical protein
MDIHKPKPVHNMRDFLKEVGIIVLSICIALTAEQAVEWVHWRAQVTEARGVIASEMAGNLRRAIRRMRTTTCTEHRLDELAAILDAAAKTGSLPPVGDIGIPPRDYWPHGAWESLVASQTATHFPRQQLADFTFAYNQIDRLEEYSPQEFATWNSLYAMVGPGRRLDPATEAKLRDALSQARSLNRVIGGISSQLVTVVSSLKLPFTPEHLKVIADAESGLLAGGLTSNKLLVSICVPIGKPPAVYGQGALSAFTPQIEYAAKHLPDFGKGAH